MKYFLDTEFIEGKQDKKFLGFKYGETDFKIDLISIGIVSEDNREYYAISKDFNLKEAWDRHDLQLPEEMGDEPIKNYWLRDNVLRPIFYELKRREEMILNPVEDYPRLFNNLINFKEFKRLINKYGKTNKQIAEDIKEFVYNPTSVRPLGTEESIEFYGWYSATDWVLFYSLYGSLMNRPKFFPMRCNDLKQLADEVQGRRFGWKEFNGKLANNMRELPNYPKKSNEHNALSDAKWNKKLYEFLTNI